MILRSLTKHVKDQNWFAVGLDFAIVVIGVFIGIQVANWNEERRNRLEEIVLVERIRVDFDRIEEDSNRALAFHNEMTSNLRTLLRSLRAGTLANDDVAGVERALLLGIAFQTSADTAGSFRELISSGKANILSDRTLLTELVDYEDYLERFEFAKEYYHALALGATEAYTSAFDYEADLQFTAQTFKVGSDVGASLIYDFETLTADPEFENAVEQLLFTHSGYTLWRERVSERIAKIQQLLSNTGKLK
ncbi:conserved hypothetical protein [gamma proteobacterium NOR5-3]|nr:conserved hypothetical protein [gamma proteobacterium NOR5-3]